MIPINLKYEFNVVVVKLFPRSIIISVGNYIDLSDRSIRHKNMKLSFPYAHVFLKQAYVANTIGRELILTDAANPS